MRAREVVERLLASSRREAIVPLRAPNSTLSCRERPPRVVLERDLPQSIPAVAPPVIQTLHPLEPDEVVALPDRREPDP
jgi:hypothetical protein